MVGVGVVVEVEVVVGVEVVVVVVVEVGVGVEVVVEVGVGVEVVVVVGMSPRKRSKVQIARMGGKARKAKLSAKRRSQIARDAANTRWTNARFIKEVYFRYAGPPVAIQTPPEAQ